MKTFLALFMGSADREVNPADFSEETIARGMAAWGAWMETHAKRIIDTGGPVGTTKKTSPDGVSDIRNLVSGYVILSAETHEEAARLFENHPHFSIFPGDSVEIMERLPVPTA